MSETDNGLTGITTHYGEDGPLHTPFRVTVKFNGVTKKTGFFVAKAAAGQEIEEWSLVAKIKEAANW